MWDELTSNDDANRPDDYHRRWYRSPKVISLVVVVLVIASLGLATAKNAFGRTVTGEVTCASGAGVVGVFIEAERLPRVWPDGPEVQSGFAANWWSTANNVAEFTYWLPFGGRVSVHLGCGGESEGTWASDNHTPLYGGDRLVVICNDPGNPAAAQPTVITKDACHRT